MRRKRDMSLPHIRHLGVGPMAWTEGSIGPSRGHRQSALCLARHDCRLAHRGHNTRRCIARTGRSTRACGSTCAQDRRFLSSASGSPLSSRLTVAVKNKSSTCVQSLGRMKFADNPRCFRRNSIRASGPAVPPGNRVNTPSKGPSCPAWPRRLTGRPSFRVLRSQH